LARVSERHGQRHSATHRSDSRPDEEGSKYLEEQHLELERREVEDERMLMAREERTTDVLYTAWKSADPAERWGQTLGSSAQGGVRLAVMFLAYQAFVSALHCGTKEVSRRSKKLGWKAH
jgi:hypothetical protein